MIAYRNHMDTDWPGDDLQQSHTDQVHPEENWKASVKSLVQDGNNFSKKTYVLIWRSVPVVTIILPSVLNSIQFPITDFPFLLGGTCHPDDHSNLFSSMIGRKGRKWDPFYRLIAKIGVFSGSRRNEAGAAQLHGNIWSICLSMPRLEQVQTSGRDFSWSEKCSFYLNFIGNYNPGLLAKHALYDCQLDKWR